MGILANALRELVAAGVTGEALILAFERIEDGSRLNTRGLHLVKEPDFEPVYTYVIRQEDGLLVKIGISKHPRFRMATLQAETGKPLILAFQSKPRPRYLATRVEKKAHELMAEWRHHGEWFSCDDEMAIDAVHRAGEILCF